MVTFKDRRRFSRLIIQLGVRYQNHCTESYELHQGQGIIRNISLSGILFDAEDTSTLRVGQCLSLTIIAPMLFLEQDHIPHLKATGIIVRLEPPGYVNSNHGVAVRLTESLSFASPDLPDFHKFTNERAKAKGGEFIPLHASSKTRTNDPLYTNPSRVPKGIDCLSGSSERIYSDTEPLGLQELNLPFFDIPGRK